MSALKRRRWRGILAVLAVAAVAAFAAQSAAAAPLVVGDVLAGVGGGNIKEFTPAGGFVQTLITGSGTYQTGMCFGSTGHLLATNFDGNSISEFDNLTGGNLGPFGSGFNADVESCTVDSAGNVYAGQADGTGDILKFSPTGVPLASYNVATQDRGSDWIDLAADQATMYYSSEGDAIKRFDVSTNTQLADFATGLPGGICYALRIRPVSGEVIVACTSEVVRLNSAGAVIQQYPIPGASLLFALNLDPDNTTFWTADLGSGEVYRVNIATGAIVTQFNSGPVTQTAGLAVVGEIRAAVDSTPPTCSIKTLITGPPKQLVIATQDTGSGLKSIVVNTSTNASTTVPSFTVGTTNEVDVTSTKIDQSAASVVSLTVTDNNNNVTVCDPVLATVKIHHANRPARQTYGHLARNESMVRLVNGKLGVRTVTLRVNGHAAGTYRVAAGRTRFVSVARYMRAGNHNKVTVIARGRVGANVTVLISD